MATLRDNWIVIAIGVAVIGALVLLIWLWWWIPKWQMRSVTAADPKARADIEDNFRKTIGQALGGAAVLIGAGAAYLQFSQQQQASHDLLISNQVAKGFEQLAAKDNLTMRLGGIYGLEGVMNTSVQYHQPVLEALCAFVRDGTIGMIVNEQGPAADIQAALTVIGRRQPGGGDVNLDGTNIPNANLLRANLRDAGLFNAHLHSAFLSGADLSGAFLIDANLSSTNLNRADVSRAHLSDANLSRAYLSGANLSDTNLSHADLYDANLSEANLRDANLSGAFLSGADLSGAKNLTQVQLDSACGTDAKLSPGLTLKPCPAPPGLPPLNRQTPP